ncbi:MAG TPA: DUF2252 domain-containing protein [Kineosporiaceae bacterium]|nr:DUF2252 domain-containing protein [Kineosporiaceae bacterium]
MSLSTWAPAEELRAQGAAARKLAPATLLAAASARVLQTGPESAGPAIGIVEAANAGRIADLVPIRIGRMASSPFAFLRGAAGVMAADLAGGADSGLYGWICGDAHAANFGLYASPERRQVMDVNDFDETVIGPWHWDLLRLVTSLVCAGRESGLPEQLCADAARDCAGAYRAAIEELAAMPLLEAYYLTTDHSTLAHHDIEHLSETFDRVRKKARKNTHRRAVEKFAQQLSHEHLRFVDDPPVLTHLPAEEAERVVAGLVEFGRSLDEEVHALLDRFTVRDVAHRIVGLGSVGNRSYVVLLEGNTDDALVLQIKQVRPSAVAPYLPAGARAAGGDHDHDGRRVVRGQRWMQTVSDILLGWTTIDGQPYLVRQFRDMKGSIDPTTLKAKELDDYARVVGVVLARAHAQSLDPRVLHGYLTTTDSGADDPQTAGAEFDGAFARFATAYADRTVADHQALLAAVRAGRLPAELGV